MQGFRIYVLVVKPCSALALAIALGSVIFEPFSRKIVLGMVTPALD